VVSVGADGQEVLLMRRVFLKFLPQGQDETIDGSVVLGMFCGARGIEKCHAMDGTTL